MTVPAVEVSDLGKMYRIGARRRCATSFREAAGRALTAPFRYAIQSLRKPSEEEILWALRDVSFEVETGEVLGIIGRNGAGKSTLLKILSRITEPSTGSATVRGRVGSLLEVGTGFHPELTGRENVYLNGAILGMRKAEIKTRFDEIVGFAEVERFIDTPVKRYSSGMRVRLGFAVAAYLEPELLLVDEVLAVGDASFRKRCLGRMNDVARSGRTVLFVSHNMGAVASLTTRCLYLHKGGVAMCGPTEEVLDRYLEDTLGERESRNSDLNYYRRDPGSESPVHIRSIAAQNACDSVPEVEMGARLVIDIVLHVHSPVSGANVSLKFKRAHGEVAATTLSWDQGFQLNLERGVSRLRCRVDDLVLVPGLYYVDVGINQSTVTRAWEVILDYPAFRIVNKGPDKLIYSPERPGAFVCRNVAWELERGDSSSA